MSVSGRKWGTKKIYRRRVSSSGKNNASLKIIIPIQIARELNIKVGAPLTIVVEGTTILIDKIDE